VNSNGRATNKEKDQKFTERKGRWVREEKETGRGKRHRGGRSEAERTASWGEGELREVEKRDTNDAAK